MKVGDIVRVLPPFNSYSGEYAIVFIDGDTYFLDGIDGGFCAEYLEAVNGD